jgi:uncharacterized protein YycO
VSTLKNGDIVLLEGKSVRSRVVRVLEPGNSRMSHMGIVALGAHTCDIIHADPERAGDAAAYISREPLQQLLRRKKIEHVLFLRCIDTNRAAQAASWAGRMFEGRIPFDNAFDLTTDSSLYCTELVWKAYRACGIDLSSGAVDTVKTPFGSMAVLFPARIARSGYLQPME